MYTWDYNFQNINFVRYRKNINTKLKLVILQDFNFKLYYSRGMSEPLSVYLYKFWSIHLMLTMIGFQFFTTHLLVVISKSSISGWF